MSELNGWKDQPTMTSAKRGVSIRENVQIERLVPRYIYHDKNGYALSKAIERAFQYVADAVERGLEIIQDPDKMPEWRLDEMAWELNCLYDYSADIETKRRWIKNAVPLYAVYGTRQAVYNFLIGAFDYVEVEENWLYGGEPFHFRVTVSGVWTPEKEAWTKRAIETAKNVRSVLDDVAIGSTCVIEISAEGDIIGRMLPAMAGEVWTGTWPVINTEVSFAECMIEVSGAAELIRVPYDMAGTKPDINTTTDKAEATVEVGAAAEDFPHDYIMPGERTRTGTEPEINVTLHDAESEIEIGAAATSFEHDYIMPGDETATGTRPFINTEGAVSGAEIEASAEAEAFRAPYDMAGTKPDINTTTDKAEATVEASSHAELIRVPYDMAGTKPDINTTTEQTGATVEIGASAEDFPHDYIMPGEETRTGAAPEENVTAGMAEATMQLRGEVEAFPIPYDMTGTKPDINKTVEDAEAQVEASGRADMTRVPYEMAGTKPDANTVAGLAEAETAIEAEATAYPTKPMRPGDDTKPGEEQGM